MRKTMALLVIAVAAIVGYFVLNRKSGLSIAAQQPNPAIPPAPIPPAPKKKKKKTVFGQIVQGVTEVAKTIPGQTGQTLSQYGEQLGSYTK